MIYMDIWSENAILYISINSLFHSASSSYAMSANIGSIPDLLKIIDILSLEEFQSSQTALRNLPSRAPLLSEYKLFTLIP